MNLNAITKITEAQKYAKSIKPQVGGFPYLAQALSQNIWNAGVVSCGRTKVR